MFAAGVTNNFAITIIAFVLLFGPIIGSIAVAPGLAVSGAYDESPAATAGIEQGDRITTVAGTPISNESELNGVLAETDERQVTVEINDGASAAKREPQTVTVERELIVAGSVGGNPAGISVDTEGDPIGVEAVNGTAVYTQAGFANAVGTNRFIELTTTRGTTTIPAGAYLTRVASDGPLAQAGVPSNPGVM